MDLKISLYTSDQTKKSVIIQESNNRQAFFLLSPTERHMSHPTPESLPTKARAPLDSLDAQEWEKFGGSISGGQGTEVRRKVVPIYGSQQRKLIDSTNDMKILLRCNRGQKRGI